MRVLLISNSGRPFLHHCREAMQEFLGDRRRLAFVSAAAYREEDQYCDHVRQALSPLGIEVLHLQTEADPLATLAQADGLFVGGGNTYHLLRRLVQAELIDPIRQRLEAGMPYLGASAGSNIAGPNILTTNDWNVDASLDFDALGLVPFNVNPHYVETDLTAAPHAETRDDRIKMYHFAQDNPVVGIEEQTWLDCSGSQQFERARVGGLGRARVFKRGQPPRDFFSGEDLIL